MRQSFAAMETEPQIQDRIRAVYCFDGPGFREDIYRKEGYLRIEKKIIKMVPQDSFVGMLLHTAGSYQGCGKFRERCAAT